MDQDFEAEAANIEPLPAPAAAGEPLPAPAAAGTYFTFAWQGVWKAEDCPCPCPSWQGQEGKGRGGALNKTACA